MVEGWVINKTREFGSKFDLQGRVVPWANRVKVRGITCLPDNNFYVVYHPTASPSQPTIGKYYNLFDVKLCCTMSLTESDKMWFKIRKTEWI